MNLSPNFIITTILVNRNVTENINSMFGEANLNIRLACGRSSASKYLTLSTPTSNIPSVCRYTIRAKSLSVCQLRVDFDINLLPPTLPSSSNNLQYPQCMSDILQIGQFRLCGTDTRQHIYIPFNRTAGDTTKDITITIAARGAGIAQPNWNLQVTQLECSLGSPLRSLVDGFSTAVNNIFPIPSRTWFNNEISPRTFYKDGFRIAPNGCTQYYPEATGTISSFNYNNGNGVYPGNMRYAICFRRNVNTQNLRLTPRSFNIGFLPNAQGINVDNNCYPQIQTPGRYEDFLMIPLSTLTTSNVRATYYCGDILNNEQVTSFNPGPLSIVFNADELYDINAPETGFSFDYVVS
ncbi:uncharacterized protein LOC129610890 [Condylostylus longicornis]|uniref:uncharacterized protein LOC129610890 n=1 Tax=Condylostylus longicornis TaxID=2530218 RepID=UPI00244E0948|nr:uncharacterized protein LOC129610890 [Condylostylus longicornis]